MALCFRAHFETFRHRANLVRSVEPTDACLLPLFQGSLEAEEGPSTSQVPAQEEGD